MLKRETVLGKVKANLFEFIGSIEKFGKIEECQIRHWFTSNHGEKVVTIVVLLCETQVEFLERWVCGKDFDFSETFIRYVNTSLSKLTRGI